MYHWIVRKVVRRTFGRLECHDYHAVVSQLAQDFEYYRSPGSHALAGRGHSREAMAAWFERMFRLFPDLQFTVKSVAVSGWPWNTLAIVLGESDADAGDEPYHNEWAQALYVRWGRVTRMEIIEDCRAVERALDRLAERGVTEACAAPIED